MKRAKNLFDRLISFENLLLASQKACKGKRTRPVVHDFHLNLEKNLFSIQTELSNKTYQPGNYREFIVYELKKRVINAAPYKDRVIHHALCNVIEPIFDRGFIYDSYACRTGKGQHKAIKRVRGFVRKHDYVLKLDIQKYFPSVDHEVLTLAIEKTIGDPDVLWLIRKIINSHREKDGSLSYFFDDDLFAPIKRKRGMPIGNLTSQIFANVYLDGLDHYIKEVLRWKAYCRYVDDLVLFGDNKKSLFSVKNEVRYYLEQLRLKIHPKKSLIFPTRMGLEFLGFRIFKDYIKVRKSSVKRFKQKLSRYRKDYRLGKVKPDKISRAIESWLVHIGHGSSYTLARDLLKEFKFCRIA